MNVRKICGSSILMAVLTLTLNDFCVTPASAATTPLIGNFTVNGQTVVTITQTQATSLTLACSKLDNITDNPSWTLKAVKSGKILFGGPGLTLSSRSVSYSVLATCTTSDTYECTAKDAAGNTDSKTVEVKGQCGSGGGDNGVSALTSGPITLLSLLVLTSLHRFRFFFQ